MGNRDNLPPETSLSHRAQRRALNTAENFALFAAIAPVAHVSGSQCYVMTFVRRGGFGDDYKTFAQYGLLCACIVKTLLALLPDLHRIFNWHSISVTHPFYFDAFKQQLQLHAIDLARHNRISVRDQTPLLKTLGSHTPTIAVPVEHLDLGGSRAFHQ